MPSYLDAVGVFANVVGVMDDLSAEPKNPVLDGFKDPRIPALGSPWDSATILRPCGHRTHRLDLRGLHIGTNLESGPFEAGGLIPAELSRVKAAGYLWPW